MMQKYRWLRSSGLLALALLAASCGTQPQPAGQGEPSPAVSPTASSPPSAAASAPAVVAAAPTPISEPATPASPTPLAAGWWDNAVCYEIFVRSFYDSNGDGIGDLNGLIEKLDYVNDGKPEQQGDLGATCIWLMPIAQATSYHGYDVSDYYTVHRDYGTNDDFKRLVAEADKRGISVILDLVLNHTSSDHPWFQSALNDPNSPYRDWYIWSPTDPGYRGPWGDVAWHKSPVRDEYYYGVFVSGMPDLNYRNPAVTAEARKISAFWLNEMGADGFRLDAIKHLIEAGQVQEDTAETHAWLREYRTFLQQTRPDAFTIGEIFNAGPVALAPYYPDQLDTYFQFDVGTKLITAAATGQARQFIGAVRVGDTSLPFQRWAPFLTNHDQDRVMSTLGDDVSKAKLAATALLTLPGLPFVYYGEEIGMLGTKPDPQIRTPMQWAGDPKGGFTEGQPWQALQPNAATVHVAAQDSDAQSLLNLYRRLIHLHTSEPALGKGSFTSLSSSDNKVGAFLRQSDDEAVLVVINFGKDPLTDVQLSLEAGTLEAGDYQLQPLLGEQPGATLTVGEGGAIAEYAPLTTLEPRTGYIFKLGK